MSTPTDTEARGPVLPAAPDPSPGPSGARPIDERIRALHVAFQNAEQLSAPLREHGYLFHEMLRILAAMVGEIERVREEATDDGR